MKKYIFTESQIKKIIKSQVNEQYGDTDSPEDMHYVQLALNKYFKSKNIQPAQIFCSDAARTRQTIKIVKEANEFATVK
jgi:broad specificity phosphatase PhoE